MLNTPLLVQARYSTVGQIRMCRRFLLKINYEFLICIFFVAFPATLKVSHADASADLWNALKVGGKVVLMRHAPVERGAEGGDPIVRDPSCLKERNLSNQGKHNAELAGSRFREHNIPVSRVFHSPFCRTAETAKIAFGKAYPAEYLSLLEILTPEEADQQTERLNQVIGSFTGDGNLVLVTHEPNITAVSFELMKHLDFLVIEPKGEGEFEELGVIRFSE